MTLSVFAKRKQSTVLQGNRFSTITNLKSILISVFNIGILYEKIHFEKEKHSFINCLAKTSGVYLMPQYYTCIEIPR